MNDLLSLTSLPNWHPAFVHFPIALLPAALLFEAIGLFSRAERWPVQAATMLYSLAAVSAAVALKTGEAAAYGLADVPAKVQRHIGATPAGACGVYVDGIGTLRVVALEVTPLEGD